MPAPLPDLIFRPCGHSLLAFRFGQSPFRYLSRFSRFRWPFQVVYSIFESRPLGKYRLAFIEQAYPREYEYHHRSHPVNLNSLDLWLQAIQLSPCRDCPREHFGLMEPSFLFFTSCYCPLLPFGSRVRCWTTSLFAGSRASAPLV